MSKVICVMKLIEREGKYVFNSKFGGGITFDKLFPALGDVIHGVYATAVKLGKAKGFTEEQIKKVMFGGE